MFPPPDKGGPTGLSRLFVKVFEKIEDVTVSSTPPKATTLSEPDTDFAPVKRVYSTGIEYIPDYDSLRKLCTSLKHHDHDYKFPDVLIFQNDPCAFVCKGIAMNRADHNQNVDNYKNLFFRLDPTDLIAKDIRYDGLPNSKVARAIMSIYRMEGETDVIQADHSDLDLVLIRM